MKLFSEGAIVKDLHTAFVQRWMSDSGVKDTSPLVYLNYLILPFLYYLNIQRTMKMAPMSLVGTSKAQLVRSISGSSIDIKGGYIETSIFNAYLQIVEEADSFICIYGLYLL